MMAGTRNLSDYPDLSTPRLSLRRLATRDAAAIVRIVGQWDVARRLARVPHPYTPDDARFFLEQVAPQEWIWAITRTGADALIGVIGLTPNKRDDRAELGYWLDPDQWGGGLMTEAGQAVLSHAFGPFGLSVVTSSYFEDNPASGRVLAKLGFMETARTMRSCLAMGRDVPSVEVQQLRRA